MIADTWQLAEYQRQEVAHLTEAVRVYGGLLADYERKLADAKRRLNDTERYLYETERSI